jgi:hypothetical protein
MYISLPTRQSCVIGFLKPMSHFYGKTNLVLKDIDSLGTVCARGKKVEL